jgi:type I restriction enzyme M protein
MHKTLKAVQGNTLHHEPLIRAMVECVQPQPMKTIADPACGTGGFFLAAYDYIVANNKLDKEQNKFLKHQKHFSETKLLQEQGVWL